MSDTNAQEPTMEEILASIRRIISEDDAPPADEDTTPPTAHVEPAASAEPAAEVETHAAAEPVQATAATEEDDVLDLTEQVDASPAYEPQSQPEQPMPNETLGDLDVFTPATVSATEPESSTGQGSGGGQSLLSGSTAQASASAFGSLSKSLSLPADGRTLEDVVNDLLRPMLKDWLDRNLAAIVEAKVQAEVDRISRTQTY